MDFFASVQYQRFGVWCRYDFKVKQKVEQYGLDLDQSKSVS